MQSRDLYKKIITSFYECNRRNILRKKVSAILSNFKKSKISTNEDLDKLHIKLWKELSSKIDSRWLYLYSLVNGIKNPAYVPEDIYYLIIEPCLNNKAFSQAYSDKNSYELLLDKELLPETIIKNIDGAFFDHNDKKIEISGDSFLNLAKKYEHIIIKPAHDSGGGKGVKLFNNINSKFTNNDNHTLSLDYITRHFSKNFIIQNYIKQYPFFSQFNSSSVNTLRVFTYRSVKDEKINILHTLLRIGKSGSFVDNQASGGISCGINYKGLLNSFAVNKYGNKYTQYNGITFSETGSVPFIDQIHQIAKEIAPKFKYARLLGFDFCVTSDSKIKIIEVNNVNNEINFYQMNNGPLFGNFTQEIIDYCKINPKSFVIDFNY